MFLRLCSKRTDSFIYPLNACIVQTEVCVCVCVTFKTDLVKCTHTVMGRSCGCCVAGLLRGTGSEQFAEETGMAFTGTLLRRTASPHATIDMKMTNMLCSTMKDPLHTTLYSIAIDPRCPSLLPPGPKELNTQICFI